MTVTMPAQPGQDSGRQPVPCRGMAWVTWPQHQAALAGRARVITLGKLVTPEYDGLPVVSSSADAFHGLGNTIRFWPNAQDLRDPRQYDLQRGMGAARRRGSPASGWLRRTRRTDTAPETIRKISFKPASRRSSHLRPGQDRPDACRTLNRALQGLRPGSTSFRHPQVTCGWLDHARGNGDADADKDQAAEQLASLPGPRAEPLPSSGSMSRG
jgi:hypothetical protein